MTREFPPFQLDTVSQCLWRGRDRTDQERVLLTPRAYALLRYLVEHPGRLLPHDELLDALWPNTHVQSEVLKSHIFEVRTALGDDSKKPLFIETQPRRGYRFIAPVSDGAAPGLSVASATGRPTSRSRTRTGSVTARRRCSSTARGSICTRWTSPPSWRPAAPCSPPSTTRRGARGAEAASGRYDAAEQHVLAARGEMDRRPVIHDWYSRMILEGALSELWLARRDLAPARPKAERFLELTRATAERTWQALAWDTNARVATAERDFNRAQSCIDQALSAMAGFEVPLAAWRLHGTAAELYAILRNDAAAEQHRASSRATILRLADSLPHDEPLRARFLSAPAVRRILPP